MHINPMLMTDFYKISHRLMTHPGTTKIYSTFTPRATRLPLIQNVTFFGLQGFIKSYLIEYFNDHFFNLPRMFVVAEYERIIKNSLGSDASDSTHIVELHKLGYLPIRIKALSEGTSVPIRVPFMTIENTHPDFYWLTNFLETIISVSLWKVITASTICKHYRDICKLWGSLTCDNLYHLPFQCHNFSYRGMSSNYDAIATGAGHLLFFDGTDTIPSIPYLEKYYGADCEKELIGCSIMASEHSIQCQYQDDLKYFRHLITEVAPSGFISIVADGYDYWDVVGRVVPALKEDIMRRDGRTVIRPDTGNPADILCGKADADTELERKGTVEALWDTFGGTVNSKGNKVLDPHIGVIYGEAITPERAVDIFSRLAKKGFASSNVVFGIGLA